ncbi:hypothetical protein QBC35DRAFT_30261, partial [Podospora australis]
MNPSSFPCQIHHTPALLASCPHKPRWPPSGPASRSSPWIEGAFVSAKDELIKKMKGAKITIDFSKVTSMDDVYREASAIQKQQAKTKTLRGLNKIKPFLTALGDFAATLCHTGLRSSAPGQVHTSTNTGLTVCSGTRYLG